MNILGTECFIQNYWFFRIICLQPCPSWCCLCECVMWILKYINWVILLNPPFINWCAIHWSKGLLCPVSLYAHIKAVLNREEWPKLETQGPSFLPGLLLELVPLLILISIYSSNGIVWMENQLIISKFTNHCSTLITYNSNTTAAIFNVSDGRMERRFLISPGRLQPLLFSLQCSDFFFLLMLFCFVLTVLSRQHFQHWPSARSSELSNSSLMSSEDMLEPQRFFFDVVEI